MKIRRYGLLFWIVEESMITYLKILGDIFAIFGAGFSDRILTVSSQYSHKPLTETTHSSHTSHSFRDMI